MKIYIEVIILFIILIAYSLIKLKLNRSKKKALKKYDPIKDMSGDFHKYMEKIDNDKNNKGGVFDTRTDERTDKGINTISVDSIRPDQPERRELLPPTTVSDVGKNSPGTGKNSSGVRARLFRRQNRK